MHLSLSLSLGSTMGGVGRVDRVMLDGISWNSAAYPLRVSKANGVYQSDFQPDAYLPPSYFTGTPLVVDFDAGSDSNNGQAGSPVKSIWRAINLVNASGNPTYVQVTGSSFPRANSFSSGSTVLEVPAWFEYVGAGRAAVYNGDVLSWSVDGTYSNIYRATRSNVVEVLDLSQVDSYGNHPRFSRQTDDDDAAVAAEGGRWARTGTNTALVVNNGGVVSNNNTRALLTSSGFVSRASLRLTGFDIQGGAGVGGCLHLLEIANGVAIIENCSFKYSGSATTPQNSLYIENSSGLFAVLDSDFGASSKDGIGSHWTTDSDRRTFILTERCRGVDFGAPGSTSNNATTGHETVVWVDVNSDWEAGRGGTVRFIQDSRLAMFGGRVAYDLGDGVTTPVVVRTDDSAEIWMLESEVISAGEDAIRTFGSSAIRTRNVSVTGGAIVGNVVGF